MSLDKYYATRNIPKLDTNVAFYCGNLVGIIIFSLYNGIFGNQYWKYKLAHEFSEIGFVLLSNNNHFTTTNLLDTTNELNLILIRYFKILPSV